LNGETSSHALAVVNQIQQAWDEFGRAVTALTLHPEARSPARLS